MPAQVQNNQGDLEDRIATDIANLNKRCKELQESIDHESLRATHEATGLKNTLQGEMDSFSKKTGERFDGLDETVDRKTSQLSTDVSTLNSDLAQEAASREGGDEHSNAKLIDQARLSSAPLRLRPVA